MKCKDYILLSVLNVMRRDSARNRQRNGALKVSGLRLSACTRKMIATLNLYCCEVSDDGQVVIVGNFKSAFQKQPHFIISTLPGDIFGLISSLPGYVKRCLWLVETFHYDPVCVHKR